MRGLLRGILMLAVVCCGGIASASKAQPGGAANSANARPGSARDPIPTLDVNFGLGRSNLLWPNRWGPVTLTLACGSTPFEGFVEMSYFQDGFPGGSVRRPVACPAGTQANIPVMMNPGRGCRRVDVSLMDQSGRVVHQKSYDMNPKAGSDEYPLAPLTDTTMAVVMGVGEPTGAARSLRQSVNSGRALSAFGTAQVAALSMDAGQLTESWTGYDSLLLLALDADVISTADPCAVAAIREWVSGGGRLVLFVNQPVDDWKQWLSCVNESGNGRSAFIAVDEPTTGSVPTGIVQALRQPATVIDPNKARLARQLELEQQLARENQGATIDPSALPEAAPDSDAPAPPDGTVETDSTIPKPPPLTPDPKSVAMELVDALPRRLIRLTQAGVQAGWQVRWGVDAASSANPATAMRGLLAEGPYGFGWVVVVGVDPGLVTRIRSPEAMSAIWKSLTERALADWNTQFNTPSQKGRVLVSDPDTSLAGQSVPTGQAKECVLERLARVPKIGNEVFYAIAASLFLLAMLLGPIDSLLLRKLHARQWSWATSLMWIGLASIAAVYIPSVLRSGSTKVNRVSVIDMIVPANLGQSGTTAPLAWRTSFTGVYSSDTRRRTLASSEPGAWWRSVSSRGYWQYQRHSGNTSRVPVTATVQTLPDSASLDPADPWAGMSDGVARGDGTQLAPAVFKIWTFRAFMDQARVRSGVGVSLTPAQGSASTDWTLRLSGIPASANIRNPAVKIGGVWHQVTFETGTKPVPENRPANATDRTAILTPKPGVKEFGKMWEPTSPSASYSRYTGWNSGGFGGADPAKLPGQLLALPGPDRRGMVVDGFYGKASASKEWAVVYLELTDMPCDVTFGDDANYSHDVVLRILVHVGAAGSTVAAPANQSGAKATGEVDDSHDDSKGNP